MSTLKLCEHASELAAQFDKAILVARLMETLRAKAFQELAMNRASGRS